MLGMCSLWGHFGVLECWTKRGISIIAQVKARLSLFPLCQERDVFASTEWPNHASPQGGAAVGSHSWLWPWGQPRRAGDNQLPQAGPPGPSGHRVFAALWVPWLCPGHSTESHPGGKCSSHSSLPVHSLLLTRKGGCSCTEMPQENSNQPFHLDKDLCKFWWIEGDVSNFNCNQRILSDKSGCFIGHFK